MVPTLPVAFQGDLDYSPTSGFCLCFPVTGPGTPESFRSLVLFLRVKPHLTPPPTPTNNPP